MTFKNAYISRFLLPALVLTLFVAVWYIIVLLDRDGRLYLIPSPPTVVKEFGENLGLYAVEGLKTAGEALAGFILGNALSFGFAIWMSYSLAVERIVYPYAIALKATPVV